jgi:hypothetical protein
MTTKTQRHFTVSLESLNVSQEGFFGDIVSKFKDLFDTTPKNLDLVVAGEKLDEAASRLVKFEKTVLRYLDKKFPGGKIPADVKMREGDVFAGTIITSLWYKGKIDLKNPVGHITSSLAEIRGNMVAFRNELDKDMRYINEVYAKVKKECFGLMTRSTQQQRFDACTKDVRTDFPGHAIGYLEKHDIHWLGGEHTKVYENRLYYVEDFKTLNKNSVFWNDSIPALTREQAEQMIALFRHLVVEGGEPYSRISTVQGVNTDDAYGRALATLAGGQEFLRLVDSEEHQKVYAKMIGMWCWMQAMKSILMWLGKSIDSASYESSDL